MISAAFFGLLLPSISQSKELYKSWAMIPVIGGFIIGGLILYALDKIVPHFHKETNTTEGPKSNISEKTKFFLAVTIHNIPEGLSVGFACGLALKYANDPTYLMSALSLAIGIAIQNLPEGSAVSLSMFDEGVSKPKSFLYGMFSGIIEPIFGVIALFATSSINFLMPWFLAFAAGAMIYVTLDELFPDSIKGEYSHYGLWSLMIGFSLMMGLELMQF